MSVLNAIRRPDKTRKDHVGGRGTQRIGLQSLHCFAEPGREMESPNYALTDQDSPFEVGDIPPGMYKRL